jgi:tetratricopeptide (TPR) repeat protein
VKDVGRLVSLHWLLVLIAVGFSPTGTAATASPYPKVSEDRCASVKAGGEIHFRNRLLVETPDITAPELRRANALLSAKCFEQAEAALQAFAAAQPDDYRIHFLYARSAWIYGNRDRAEAIASAALRQHPQFASMKVLLASMRVDDQDFKKAQQWLDEVEAAQPNDLWAYIDRLRIDAQVLPSRDVALTLRDIVADAAFPPSARQQAAAAAKYMPGVTEPMRDEIFKAQMADGAGGDDCTLAMQAVELIEGRDDPAAGAAILETYIKQSRFCLATPLVRTMLAEAYLMQAAKISAAPSSKTQRLVQQAHAVLHGDLTPVAQRAAVRPTLAALIPYLRKSVDPLQIDEAGRNVLCNAVLALNAPMVKAELERGADPSARCEGDSLVMHVLLTATTDKVAERQKVLRHLLEHRAPVEGLEFCAHPDNGDCRFVLLPILQEFAARKPVTVTQATTVGAVGLTAA